MTGYHDSGGGVALSPRTDALLNYGAVARQEERRTLALGVRVLPLRHATVCLPGKVGVTVNELEKQPKKVKDKREGIWIDR